MSKVTQSPAYYTAQRNAMNEALRLNGIRLTFRSKAAAKSFQNRCYEFRALMRSLAAEKARPGEPIETPYDVIFFPRQTGDDKVLIMELRGKDGPEITALDGSPVPEDKEEDFGLDELLNSFKRPK